MVFPIIFLFALLGTAQAQNDNMPVSLLPKGRAVFTLVRDIQLPTDRNADLWIQGAQVSSGERLRRGEPGCTLRHYGRGIKLRSGTAFVMPDNTLRATVSSFRSIPLERSTGMVLDCAATVDYGRFGPYLAGDGGQIGILTIGQLRQALQGTFRLTIRPRD